MPHEGRRMGGTQGPGPTAQQKYRMQLYQDHYEHVRRYFARHVECPQDVDDLVQTVFLNLMANTGAVRNPRRYVQAAARRIPSADQSFGKYARRPKRTCPG